MKTEDHNKLSAPYRPGENLDVAFAQRLEVHVQEFTDLYNAIYQDLDERTFGVGWWAPHLGTKRRILISHYLLQCVKSVEANLIEAGLHRWEANDNLDKESNFLADSVSRSADGKFHIKMPPRLTPHEDLAHRMTALHTIGFFRAVVGALDCLGASVIAVLALPADLRHASLATCRNILSKSSHSLHKEFREQLERSIAEVGPKGWIEWITDFRNMVVHRGRRLHMVQLVPRQVKLYGPDMKILPRVSAAEQLPRDPYLSQVEAFLNSDRIDVLSESAEDTMIGVMRSCVHFTKDIGKGLLEIWQLRRSNPSLLPQPKENWPEGVCSEATGFLGYRPGSLPGDPTQITGRTEVARQLLTAALADHLRKLWDSFD